MIMNKKIVRREQPVEMEEPESDYVYNLECEKMRIYNNARFYETIKDYPEAMNIVREMVYFNDEIENMIHFINRSNDVESLYVQRNILIESFGRFTTARVYDLIDKIFNEAINQEVLFFKAEAILDSPRVTPIRSIHNGVAKLSPMEIILNKAGQVLSIRRKP